MLKKLVYLKSEVRMLRLMSGNVRKDRIKNECVHEVRGNTNCGQDEGMSSQRFFFREKTPCPKKNDQCFNMEE